MLASRDMPSALSYQPGVRLVLGFSGHAAHPPATYASPATTALQQVVAARGKDWKKVAPKFVVAPAAGSGRVVVGLAMARAPQLFDAPRQIEPRSAVAKKHFVVPTGFGGAPEVDKYGNTGADEGILPALTTGDPVLEALGLELDPHNGQARWFLLSDDGRPGAVVAGRILWKPGAVYQAGGVRTWSYDYGDGEGARLVGVPYAEVGDAAPICPIDHSPPACSAHLESARAAVQALLPAPAADGWVLVAGAVPGPYSPAAEPAAPIRVRRPRRRKAPLALAFSQRPLAAVLEALPSGEPFRAQPLEGFFLRGYARADLLAPPEPAPHAALFELREAPSPSVLIAPDTLLRASAPLEAIGAWNARGTGRLAHGDGWSVLEVELVPEQEDAAFDERVGVIAAVFALEAGRWASLVWPGARHEEVAQILGFDPWNQSVWTKHEVWLGE